MIYIKYEAITPIKPKNNLWNDVTTAIDASHVSPLWGLFLLSKYSHAAYKCPLAQDTHGRASGEPRDKSCWKWPFEIALNVQSNTDSTL